MYVYICVLLSCIGGNKDYLLTYLFLQANFKSTKYPQLYSLYGEKYFKKAAFANILIFKETYRLKQKREQMSTSCKGPYMHILRKGKISVQLFPPRLLPISSDFNSSSFHFVCFYYVYFPLLLLFRLLLISSALISSKSTQRQGTEAIRTQIQPSKPKCEITNITNSQNTKENIWPTE